MWCAFPRVPFWQTRTRPHFPKLPLPRIRTHTQVGVKMVGGHKQCWKQSSLWLSPSRVTGTETDVQRWKVVHRRAHSKPRRLPVSNPLSSQSCIDLLQGKTWVPECSQNSYNAVPFSCFQMSRFHLFTWRLLSCQRLPGRWLTARRFRSALSLAAAIFSMEPAFPLEADSNSQNTAWALMFTKLAV